MISRKLYRSVHALLIVCVAVASLLLHGCNSEAASLWELVDPGGGGAAPAIYRIPGSPHLFVGSDVGGLRYSADAGKQFRVVNEGLDFSSSAGDNIQDITGYRRGDTSHVVASATAGMLYWRSIGANGLGPTWVKFFDAERVRGRGAATLGALAVDTGSRYLYAGVGNLNNLDLNRLTELDPAQSGRIYIFRTGDDADGPAAPQADGMLSLTAICADLQQGPYLHITDLRAVNIDIQEYLYVGTSEGLLIVKNPRSDSVDCQRRLVPGRNSYVLGVRPSREQPGDVVLLLNEGSLSLQARPGSGRNRAAGKLLDLGGGLFHTRSVLEQAPDWQDITPVRARGLGLGKLERGQQRPAELLLSGDARSPMGVLFTADFQRGRWQVAVDDTFVSSRGKGRNFDGWRRYGGRLRGVKEIAIDESGEGIATLYVGGFQGMLLTGRRDGDGFRFEQSYTNSVGGSGGVRYLNRGLPLMNPWRAYPDPRRPEQVLFLYHDNIFFVGNEADASFRRPLEKFGWGTDVVFDPGVPRTFVAYSVGNRLEEGRRSKAERGGILVGTRDTTRWREVKPRLPVAGPVEALALVRGELCANVYRKGVFCTALDDKLSWQRAVPKTPDVLHLINVEDDRALWLITASGQTRQICRFANDEPTCNDLPVTGSEFERLWFDAGRLWLTAKGDASFSSELQFPLHWESVDAEISDLRSVSHAGERITLIASGIDGLFASRAPQERDTWCQVSGEGLNGNRVVTAIDVPAGGDYLYIAVAGVGFYRASLDSLAAELAQNCPH